MADVLQVARVRILGYLKQHRVVEAGPEATVLDDGLAERELLAPRGDPRRSP